MLQISKQNTLVQFTDEQMASLQKQWRENHFVVLPKVIDPVLLNDLRQALKRGEFLELKHPGVDATELMLKPDSTINFLEMAASNPAFSNVISKITNLKPLGYFQGRVYSISHSDHDDWHQDYGLNYMLTMSINLSPKPYKGGHLQLRDVETKKVLGDIQNIGPGDALIFNISKTLEHKLTPVTGENPKIAFAGWFCSEPNYKNYMSRVMQKIINKSTPIIKFSISPQESKNELRKEIPKINESVAFRTVANKTMIVNLGDDSQCVLNRMGSKIWESLCRRESADQTICNLQKTYDLDLKVLQTEYYDFVDELIEAGYLIPQ